MTGARRAVMAVWRRVAVLALVWSAVANAHIASNGFLTLNVEGSTVAGTIELAMRDAELAIGLDSNRDGKITWGEVRSHQHDLELYVRSKLSITGGASSAGVVGHCGAGSGVAGAARDRVISAGRQ